MHLTSSPCAAEGRYPGSWGFVPVAGPFRVRAACHCCQRQAIGAFRRALEIQPYENQSLILAREENIKTVLEIGSSSGEGAPKPLSLVLEITPATQPCSA
ncbi:MAG: hypothetical protein GDA48_00550 [Hormoscilla sp. GM102CHS1]|nr:hypothetical protein [Hormoscilla sp. GM102CHS1]